jgi:hypothetical protein
MPGDVDIRKAVKKAIEEALKKPVKGKSLGEVVEEAVAHAISTERARFGYDEKVQGTTNHAASTVRVKSRQAQASTNSVGALLDAEVKSRYVN